MYEFYSIEILNFEGKVVHRADTKNIQINVSHLPVGKYTVNFKDQEKVVQSLPVIKL